MNIALEQTEELVQGTVKNQFGGACPVLRRIRSSLLTLSHRCFHQRKQWYVPIPPVILFWETS